MANSRLKEAFIQGPNLIGLAAVGAAAMAGLTIVPLLVGAVAEAAYLLFVPDTRWIRGRVERQKQAEENARQQAARQELLGTMRPDLRERYERLAGRREEIAAAAGGDAAWYRDELVGNLDYLLDKFLLFASKEAQYRSYLLAVREEELGQGPVRSTGRGKGGPRDPDPDVAVNWAMETVEQITQRYRSRQDALRASAAREQEADARGLLEQRATVLARRQEYLEKSGRAFINIHRQLTLLEDTFGLVNDQIRARPAQDIKADLDGVLATTESMTTSLDEMAELEQSLSLGTQV